ncbi:MurR/RpiR family transcriptional regulator [Candidatus Stoquefichus massiliensis]|uniref:MurR/RpiR family transcriptional regulator n=1 Tax=Candidatus Stoquefichus massiliensis TaxID=1470350 RepID=UPI0004B0C9ED|nr:MurR/RpiR family transcriptional regulator [Candidatus Stoquefichus massiliensis]
MIIERLIDEKELTESEKQIGYYILDKNNELAMTSVELAKRSYTSQSTVMRLYKKLGFQSYREFISQLILERNEYFKIDDIAFEESENYMSDYEEVKSLISKMYALSLVKTNILLDKNVVIRICNRLLSASSIDVYAIGISSVLGRQLVFKLQSLGLQCTFHDVLNIHYVHKRDQRNVSIVFGLSGKNPAIYNIVQTLSKQKNYIVSILGCKENKIIDLCDDHLIFFTNQIDHTDVMIDLFTGEYIVNLIYMLLKGKFQNKSD